MSLKSIMTAKIDTVFVDKYSGAEFTQPELAGLAVPMMRTDTRKDIDQFFERFEPKQLELKPR